MRTEPAPPNEENDGTVETLEASPPTDEETYYLQRYYQAPVENLAKIEDIAKFLIGATATVSGLCAAAVKLIHSSSPPAPGDSRWLTPFVLWALSIAVLVITLFLHRYKLETERTPDECRKAFIDARKWKWWTLAAGTLLFIAGRFTALFLLQS